MKYKSSYLVFLLGLIYLLAIHFFINEEVFFSEDGGIKMLMIKQYVSGNLNNTLVVNAPAWAHELWDQGLYYFTNPFVYETPRGNMPVFPPYFSMINAPLYKTFGFHGLYIIPALSLLTLWFLFIQICKKLGVSERSMLLSTIMLVFGSSLTFYASVFWEHTLAALCCFVGFYFLIKTEVDKKQDSPILTIIMGIACGMALWFRPESFFIIGALMVWSICRLHKSSQSIHYFFIGGVSISLFIFFAFNYYLYESFTGLHSKQIIEQVNGVERIKQIGYIFLVLVAKTIIYDPIVLVFLICGFLLRKIIIRDFITDTKPLLGILLLVAAFFYIISPLILPNTGGRNWGIRYALVCIPLFYIAVALLFDRLIDSKFNNAFYALFIVIIGYGVYQNTYNGSKLLYSTFNGAKTKVIDYLQKNPPSILLLTKSYQAAEFEVLSPQALFFRTDTKETMNMFLSRPEIKNHKVILLYDLGDNKYKELLLKPEHLTNFRKVKTIESYILYELESTISSVGQ